MLGLRIGADVEGDDDSARSLRQRHIRRGDTANGPVDNAGFDLVRTKLFERGVDRLDGALHVALDDKEELLLAVLAGLLHHLFERACAGAADLTSRSLRTRCSVSSRARASFSTTAS